MTVAVMVWALTMDAAAEHHYRAMKVDYWIIKQLRLLMLRPFETIECTIEQLLPSYLAVATLFFALPPIGEPPTAREVYFLYALPTTYRR